MGHASCSTNLKSHAVHYFLQLPNDPKFDGIHHPMFSCFHQFPKSIRHLKLEEESHELYQPLPLILIYEVENVIETVSKTVSRKRRFSDDTESQNTTSCFLLTFRNPHGIIQVIAS